MRPAVPAAFLAGLLLGAATLGAARAQQPQPAPFEYRVFRMDPADYAGKADYEEIKQRAGNDPIKADAPFQEHVLNALAQEGWELMTIERPRPNLVHFVLRRPKR